jgi:Tol biopolymer transport system component
MGIGMVVSFSLLLGASSLVSGSLSTTSMSLTAGARLGPYEILAPLGAGGMGEVYRARDTRLEREVAVKVLPKHLSSSEEMRQRFEREAKAISQLSHPHICALYDVGSHEGTEYLVMELLEGETVAARLAKGALPLEQILKFGVEIADALDKAHRQGIVHRDLKPGNVMLTKSGVKLLDFGLAKAMAPAQSQSGLTSLPTVATPQNLTQQGTILGTFQYMAPEQLEGREADSRSDIFAFGAVVYEMATGQKAFTGKSQASLIGSILHTEPPLISTIQPMTPPALERAVRTCLAKDPDDRFQTAHDVKLQLQWIAEGGSAVGVPAPVVARRRSRERLAWAAAAAATLAALAPALLFLTRPREAPRTVQSSILPPEKSAFVFEGGPMALSPDGRRLAFVAPTAEGKSFLLWVRPLSGMAAQPLAGTDGATYPFWSPDSRFLGFFAGGKLKKIDASGGPPQALCDATNGRGGTWNQEGVIIFTPSPRDPVMRVSSAGGAPAPVTELDVSKHDYSHRFPFFLPDGRHFLYLAQSVQIGQRGAQEICIGSLDSKKCQPVLHVDSNAVFAPSSPGASSGHIFYVRERTLLAQPFDAKRLRFTGEAFPVGEQVQYFSNYGFGVFTASENGVLAYESGGTGGMSQMVWLDRAGKQLEAVGAPADYMRPRISRDGRRFSIDIVDPQVGQADIWVYDLARRVSTRFTFGPADSTFSLWSPDDSRIVFQSNRKGQGDLFNKVSSGTGNDEEVLVQEGSLKVPTDWSSDGRFVVYHVIDAKTKTGWDLGLYSVAEKKASLFLSTSATELNARFSPDSRWLSYQSDESGRPEIYVQPVQGHSGKWQISTAGGSQAVWNRNGKEIFYVSPDNKLMAVDVKADSGFEAGTPKALFDVRLKGITGWKYDVSPDGQRFLANVSIGEARSSPITLVLNWAAEVKK